MVAIATKDEFIRKLHTAAIAILVAWAILLGGKVVYLAAHAAPSFDGAMNLEVARSMANGDGYRRLFQDREPFPHEIQTNAPFIVPAAIIYEIFGVGILQSSIVNIAYFVLLAVLSAMIVRSAGGKSLDLALGLTAILITPGLVDYGFRGYGEIPALAWIFLSVAYYFRRPYEPQLKRSLITGVLLALSFLTKTVMLIGVAAFAIGVLTQLLFHRTKSLSAWLNTVAMGAGFGIPVVAYESWKAISLGGIKEWAYWWTVELNHIGGQAGVNSMAEGGLGAEWLKLTSHIHVLAGFYHLPFLLTAIWVSVVIATSMTIVFMSFSDERYLATSVILCMAAAYLVWWTGITVDSRAWLRRIIDGMVCANVGMLMAIRLLLSTSASKNKPARPIIAGALALVPLMLFYQATANIFQRHTSDNSDLLTLSHQIKNLPEDAYIFGVGWWSAPEVALLSGRHILNFNQFPVSRIDARRPAYVVKTPIAAHIGQINQAFAMYGLQVPSTLNYGLFRLHGFAPRPMSRTEAPVKSEINDTEDYPYLQGAYKAIAGFGIWLSSDSTVMLTRGKSNIFELTGYAAAQEKYLYPEKLRLALYIDGCAAHVLQVPTEKVFTISIKLTDSCPKVGNDPVTVRMQFNNVIDYSKTHNDFRSLSMLVKKLGFTTQDAR